MLLMRKAYMIIGAILLLCQRNSIDIDDELDFIMAEIIMKQYFL